MRYGIFSGLVTFSKVTKVATKHGHVDTGIYLLQAPFKQTMATISAHPLEDLVDVPVRLAVSGLDRARNVTLYATLTDKKMTFASCGHYAASRSGEIDVSQDCSLGGTYTGVEPMGLFWSMKQTPGQKPGLRLGRKDVTIPVLVNLSVHSGHQSMEEIHSQTSRPLATSTLSRWYVHKDVTRTEIRHGDVRGTLFIPPGAGPFPGVIDMHGTAGGQTEFRAALLASRGFLTLALPYFNYQDLPPNLVEVDFSYFPKAVDWFAGLPQVQSGGIGAVGLSKGGEIAMWMAVHCPQISAVVNVSGTPFLGVCSMKFGVGELPGTGYDFSKVVTSPEGTIFGDSLAYDENCLIPIHKSRAKVLTLMGEDDRLSRADYHKYYIDWLPEWKRPDVELVIYPDTGHLIEPPFHPFTRASFHILFRDVILYGGRARAHSHNQVLAWGKLQSFLKQNVGRSSSDRISSQL